jgi:uncharacterized protein YndB with AHSA1/START domain
LEFVFKLIYEHKRLLKDLHSSDHCGLPYQAPNTIRDRKCGKEIVDFFQVQKDWDDELCGLIKSQRPMPKIFLRWLHPLSIVLILSFNVTTAQTQQSTTMNTTSYTMTITRTFNASIEKVWNAFSNGESIKRWWGPAGFTAPVANINFREGGVSLVCMRSPEGFEIFNTWTYQKITSMKSIEFIQHFTDKSGNKLKPSDIGMPPGIPDEVPHILTFRKVDNEKTELTITELNYTNAQIVEISKAGTSSMLKKFATEVER